LKYHCTQLDLKNIQNCILYHIELQYANKNGNGNDETPILFQIDWIFELQICIYNLQKIKFSLDLKMELYQEHLQTQKTFKSKVNHCFDLQLFSQDLGNMKLSDITYKC
jgi:hypothetical protein